MDENLTMLANFATPGLLKREDFWNKGYDHCVKSVRIRSYSGLYFATFGLNTERSPYSPKCGKIRTRITPNTDTFHAKYSISRKAVIKICSKKSIFLRGGLGSSSIIYEWYQV